MKNILHELFHGRVPGRDCNAPANPKVDELTQKIKSERQYFASIMSDANFKRFRKLERLHCKKNYLHYMDTFTNAFKLGAMLMCALFADEDDAQKQDDNTDDCF